jgi:F-type H+-transporting ATPase subunit c
MTLLFFLLNAVWGLVAAAFGASITAIGAAFGISRIGTSALEAIARQPEASGDIRSTMIVSAALIEGVAFFAVIVCALIIFLG